MAESGSADRGRFKLCLRKDITVEDYVETLAGDGYGSAKLALRFSPEKEWFWREAALLLERVLLLETVPGGNAHTSSLF